MISAYLREQKRYSQKDLSARLKCGEEEAVLIIRKLKEYGVLKAVRASDPQKDMSELLDEDVEIADVEAGENEYLYVFVFVGVVVVAGRVLKCYPKYLLHKDEPKEELCQVMKALERYNSREQIVRMFNESSESASFNLLAVLLYLLQDYYENGVYSNSEEVVESNGPGEIMWDETINETFALISGNRPYYPDLRTIKRVSNDYDYFKRLHECILTKASRELEEADLLDLFELTGVELTEEGPDDFGDKDYILYRIENELSVQFNTRKQLVLKTMYAYIAHSGSLYDAGCLSLFGTAGFNMVWEKICAEIMDNQLKTSLKALNLPRPLLDGYDPDDKLIDIIERPQWTITGKTADDTLIPDIVTIDGAGFFIFDAKYYNAVLSPEKPPKGQPGIESVTKQYLYQLAYRKFIDGHGFTDVRNCFLLPTADSKIRDGGEVRMGMFASEPLSLQDIKVRFLPATMAYDCYLSGKKMDIAALRL